MADLYKTNADALIGMIMENIDDFIACVDSGEIGPQYCRIQDCNDDSGEACKRCLRKWLAEPFTGSFEWRDGCFRKG